MDGSWLVEFGSQTVVPVIHNWNVIKMNYVFDE